MAKTPLTDEQVHELLVKAEQSLGKAPAATLRGSTALETARRALGMLQMGLVRSMEEGLGGDPATEDEPPTRR